MEKKTKRTKKRVRKEERPFQPRGRGDVTRKILSNLRASPPLSAPKFPSAAERNEELRKEDILMRELGYRGKPKKRKKGD